LKIPARRAEPLPFGETLSLIFTLNQNSLREEELIICHRRWFRHRDWQIPLRALAEERSLPTGLAAVLVTVRQFSTW